MRGSLLIIAFFALGAALAYLGVLPAVMTETDYSVYFLYGLMFSVGLNIGYDKKILATLRTTKFKVILIPLGTLIGTLLGAAIMSIFIPKYSPIDCMAVGSGLGYYSLSSIFITQYKGAELGTIALMSNIIRELFVLLSAPLLVAWFGKFAPISAAGVTSMDTALPLITRFSGPEFVVIALFHGISLDVCVPFLVTFLCWI